MKRLAEEQKYIEQKKDLLNKYKKQKEDDRKA